MGLSDTGAFEADSSDASSRGLAYPPKLLTCRFPFYSVEVVVVIVVVVVVGVLLNVVQQLFGVFDVEVEVVDVVLVEAVRDVVA